MVPRPIRPKQGWIGLFVWYKKGKKMRNLLEVNCFDTEESIVLLGSCLMGQEIVQEVEEKISPNLYSVCLESTHFNMVVTKVLDIIARKKTKKIAVVTVDKSPHCVQLHYLTKEIENILEDTDVKITDYVVVGGKLVEIPKEVIGLSKNLVKLTQIQKGEK